MYLRLIDDGMTPEVLRLERLPGKLWVGSRPRDERDLDQLTARSISAVVTLSKKPPCELVQRRYQGAWWQLHLQDGLKLQPDEYLRAARWAARLVDDGHRVLVHCLAGRNRSCLVAALALRERYGLDGATAVDQVREARPRAFHNEAQLAWLRALPRPQ